MALIGLLVFGAVITLALGLLSLPRRSVESKRLARLADGTRAVVGVPADQGSILSSGEPGLWSRWMSRLGGQTAGEERERHHPIRRRLMHAGYRQASSLATFLGSRIALAIGLPMVLLSLPPVWQLTGLRLMALLTVAALAGYALPGVWVNRRVRARQGALTLGLPDALDLMVVCVEAGLGTGESLLRISREFARSNPVLSAEFELVVLETRAGKSSTEALRSLAERTGLSDISALVSMLVQTERFGTSLADTLRVHADAMRTQRMQRAEEMAAKAPLKMLFPMVVIFVATMVVTIGPGIIEMASFFSEQAASR
jgi:tight adherence protein C